MTIIKWLLLILPIGAGFAAGAVPGVPQWTRFETRLEGAGDYRSPVHDLSLTVEFKSPGGASYSIAGFWDGGRTWKVRFSPNETGKWTYRTSSTPRDSGLNGREGAFECVPYSGSNPLYRHGPLRVAQDRYHLEHADGTPFLWLGDTTWYGPVRSNAADWNVYLKDRHAKGFNVIQTAIWSPDVPDSEGHFPYTGEDRIKINPLYFQHLDEGLNAVNEHGMVIAPNVFWAIVLWHPVVKPPVRITEDQLIVLSRYAVARYGAHQVVWMVFGDGVYTGESAARWKRIAREILALNHPERIATLHGTGRDWTSEEYVSEPWFAFNSYQSGHKMNEDGLRWASSGPPSRSWRKEPHCPAIDIEPNYEGYKAGRPAPGSTAVGAQLAGVFDAWDVRRSLYWGLLVAPAAGVGYGANGLWSWESSHGEPLNSGGESGVALPWFEAIHMPGSTAVAHVRKLFSTFEWWRLRPAQELLEEQPGDQDLYRFVMIAVADDGKFSLAYLPRGGSVRIRSEKAGRARWYNPATGKWNGGRRFAAGTTEFTAPSGHDWALWRAFGE